MKEIMTIRFYEEDVIAMAETAGVPPEVALERVGEWIRPIRDQAIGTINKSLYEAVKEGQV